MSSMKMRGLICKGALMVALAGCAMEHLSDDALCEEWCYVTGTQCERWENSQRCMDVCDISAGPGSPETKRDLIACLSAHTCEALERYYRPTQEDAGPCAYELTVYESTF
jgi:hypothetical protein